MGPALATFLTVVFSLMTFLPLVRNDFWTFRALEYPRLQKLVLGLFLILVLVVFRTAAEGLFFPMLIVLSICCIYLSIKIYPYTRLAPYEMRRLKKVKDGHNLRLFTANVLQHNRQYSRLLDQIRKTDPDVIFLVETDSGWEEGVSELKKQYEHGLACPLDNTYGLLLFSRLPMRGGRVLYRTDPEVPSIEAEVQLPCGTWVNLYGLHPKPPVPHESMYSTSKDKELMKLALKLKGHQQPCIVMGDLNDVAWSHVTGLFRKVSGLLDPRRGRGFYSTFSADHWWMRFPLDYIFCSAHFGLLSMQCLPHNGSDHFAMITHLQYEPPLNQKQERPEADREELQEVKEKSVEEVPAE